MIKLNVKLLLFDYLYFLNAEIKGIMKTMRLLFAFFVGTFFYTVLSFIGGSDGVWAHRQLQEQKQILSANASSIEKTNNELSLEKLALQKDLDVIAAYAKKLGYVSESEKLVKISGLASRETHVFDPGTAVRHVEVKSIPEWVCKSCSLTIILLVYLVLLLSGLQTESKSQSSHSKKKEDGIVVYDLQ